MSPNGSNVDRGPGVRNIAPLVETWAMVVMQHRWCAPDAATTGASRDLNFATAAATTDSIIASSAACPAATVLAGMIRCNSTL